MEGFTQQTNTNKYMGLLYHGNKHMTYRYMVLLLTPYMLPCDNTYEINKDTTLLIYNTKIDNFIKQQHTGRCYIEEENRIMQD